MDGHTNEIHAKRIEPQMQSNNYISQIQSAPFCAESGQLEVMPQETRRAHHRPCGRGEEAGAGGARSTAAKIENLLRNDGGTVSVFNLCVCNDCSWERVRV